jgi:CobQ-like glutamine amidotransferase family enzyme
MTARSTVTIGLLLPDVLGTYSDSGNATVLAQRLRWRGIPAEVLRCTADQPPPTGCDVYLLGGGEDAAQLFAADWLRDHPALCRALATSSLTLAVCAGMQILGRTMADLAGNEHRGVELLDVTTRPRRRRAIGNIVTTSQLPGVGKLCGFENHRGGTTLGPDARPLGRVVSGIGNGARGFDQRRHEGVVADRIIGTYLHGPVLARNPALADHVLARVTGAPLPPLELPDQAALRKSYL